VGAHSLAAHHPSKASQAQLGLTRHGFISHQLAEVFALHLAQRELQVVFKKGLVYLPCSLRNHQKVFEELDLLLCVV